MDINMNKDLEKFRELLLTDEEFQKKLQAAAVAYTGDQTEEAVFNNVLVPIASGYGISATFDEFKDYISSLNDDAEMSKEELSQVAGGKINGGGVGATECAGIGIGFGASAGSESGGGCVVIGGGWGKTMCLTVGTSEGR